MVLRIALFGSLFFVALTVGGAFGVALAYNPAGMSATFYVETMQHAIRSFAPLAVALNLGMLFTIGAAVLARHDRAVFYLLIAAIICIIAGNAVTIFGNWPINNKIITWNFNSPPSNWTALRDSWWRFHIIRFVLGLAGLSALLLAVLRRREEPA